MNIFVVDDEKNIRQNLLEFIPWHTFGNPNVISSKNGKQAIEKMIDFEPHILLTDIRMPKMNGIELATYVRDAYPDCVILFFSGYADKEYLKSAIHLQAIDYIEKPLDNKILQNHIQNAVALYNDRIISRKSSTFYKSAYDSHYNSIKKNLLNSLITGDSNSINNINTILNRHDMVLNKTKYYTVIYISLCEHTASTLVTEYQNKISELFNSQPYTKDCLGGFISHHEIALIVEMAHTNQTTSTLLQPLLDILATTSIKCTIGIGLNHLSNQAIPQSYLEASKASSLSFYKGFNKIYHYGDYHTEVFTISDETIAELHTSIQNGDLAKAMQVLNEIYFACSNSLHVKVKDVVEEYMKVSICVSNYYETQKAQAAYITNQPQSSIKRVEAWDSLSALHQYSKEIVMHAVNAINNASHENARIRSIIKYIDQHFNNTQFNQSELSSVFNLSQSYLCSYFKTQTGEKLNQYVTDKRIEYAKDLLHNSHKKINEIALEVGYTDPNYFSSLFKKHVGITPRQYRERMPNL